MAMPGQDMAALLAATQSPTANQPSRMLGIFGDVQFTNFKMPSPGWANTSILRTKPRQSKLMGELGFSSDAFLEGFRKAAQNAGVMYAGDLPQSYLPGRSNIEPASGGAMERS